MDVSAGKRPKKSLIKIRKIVLNRVFYLEHFPKPGTNIFSSKSGALVVSADTK